MQIYVNGQFLSADTPCIHPADRGFRYGDGLFETLRLQDGIPYQWDFHLKRLEDGLKALSITLDTTPLAHASAGLIRRNSMAEGLLRIAISRGRGGRGYLPGKDDTPTVVIETLAASPGPTGPYALWLSSYEKISPKALPVQAKLAQGLNATLARIEADRHGCQEALQLNAAGEICETSGANILWLKDGALHTPALACGALNGSTRYALMRIAPMKIKEGVYKLEDLRTAEAVVVCNAAIGVAAVTALKPQDFQWKSVALAQQLHDVLQADITRDTQAQASKFRMSA